MNLEDAFLQAILEDPDDDAPRLIYADWLEERGDPRGEFIHVQCALAQLAEDDPRRLELEERERELLETHEEEWTASLRQLVDFWRFRRGFVEEVAVEAALFLARAEELFHLAPVRLIELVNAAGLVEAVAASPSLARLTGLELSRAELGAGGVRLLAASPHLARLTALDLWCNDLGDEGAEAVAGSPHLARLTDLDLGNNRISDAGAQALAASPCLTHLIKLNLRYNTIHDAGAQALAASPLAGAVFLD